MTVVRNIASSNTFLTSLIAVVAVLSAGISCAQGVAPTPLAESLALDYWDESRFAKFADGQPLTVDERQEVDRLVKRLASFDRRVFLTTPAETVSSKQLLDAPKDFRGKLVQWDGRLEELSRQEGDNNGREVSSTLFRAADPTPCAIVTESLPWQLKTTPLLPSSNRSIRVRGVFVKLIALDDGWVAPLIAAPRVAWYPKEWDPPVVNYGMSVLGILGIDVALLDRVEHREPLRRNETAAFYQLLSGMRGTTGSQLIDWAQRHMPRHQAEWRKVLEECGPKQQALAREVLRVGEMGSYAVAPFFNAPDLQVGQLAAFDGVVRRAIRIEVADDLDATAAGIDHYYELAVFTDDSQSNPLMFAVLDVPPELPLGDDVRATVRVGGFFFKSWRYTSRQAEDTGGERLRFAPLFVGHSPLRIVPPAEEPIWGWITGLGFIGVVALVWITGWWRSRNDRAFAKGTLARIKQPIEPVEFDPDEMPHQLQ